MTEQQWRASYDPAAMVEFVLSATTTVRTRWQGPRSGRRFAGAGKRDADVGVL